MDNYDEILDQLYQEKELLEKKIVEYSLMKQYVKDLKKEDNAYINVGGYIFAKGSIADQDNLLINVGRGIFIEKSRDDVLKIIDEVVNKLTQELDNLNKNILVILNRKKSPQPL
ncbi:prefoldin subunit alpha [Nanobdella aerobiophila]|uniref:Prefoldin subunit alpha n=1 Tax=Nanobdella aerobiophila TaxID=2586965 RepID=A0A915SSF9_9ARCH|nr:prefoldin subunit alpha [Nanobdella aerobiophila]BBL45366.1 prefoldin subunit alpha [Nanobdella aerobiophila]